MSGNIEPADGVLSVEFFAAKDQAWLAMAVPLKCGLKQADTLRIIGLTMVALRKESILPIDLPPLTETVRQRFIQLGKSGNQIPVGEFMARGLFDAYFLNVVIS